MSAIHSARFEFRFPGRRGGERNSIQVAGYLNIIICSLSKNSLTKLLNFPTLQNCRLHENKQVDRKNTMSRFWVSRQQKRNGGQTDVSMTSSRPRFGVDPTRAHTHAYAHIHTHARDVGSRFESSEEVIGAFRNLYMHEDSQTVTYWLSQKWQI